jgi:hypothetical protein
MPKIEMGLPEEIVERQRCSISISDSSIDFYFSKPIDDAPHKPTHVERLASAALFGIARALAGKAEGDMLRAMETAAKGRKR